MRKITEILNSPLRIGVFALCITLIVSAVAFASIQAGASVNANKTIGLDKGVEVALADAGFNADQVTALTAHYDNEAGVASYEVDFSANGFEYDYTIKASDGTILEASREKTAVPAEPASTGEQEKPPAAQPESKPEVKEEVKQEAAPSTSSNNDTSAKADPSSKYIGVDKAKSIALKDAGVSSSDAVFTKAKLDKDDGRAVYEIEFYSGRVEYEYEINATSGKITDKDSDIDDDWDNDWD